MWLPSSSAHIHHGEQELIGLGGWRCYCIVADASAIPDLTDYLYQGLWAEGYGFVHVGGRGQRLGRCLIDRAVAQPERLDFVATPVLGEGLTRRSIEPEFRPGADVLDWQPKDFMDQKTWERENETYRAAWIAVEPEAKRKARTAAVELTQCASTKRAQDVMWRAVSSYELSGDFELEMQNGHKMTVADLLEEGTEDYHLSEMPDPLDPSYRGDRRIAVLNLRPEIGENPIIYSHARGGILYFLKQDEAEIMLDADERSRITDEALRLMRNRGDVYQRDTVLQYIGRDGRGHEVNDQWLGDYLDRHARWKKIDRTGTPVAASVPDWLPKRINGKVQDWKLPTLNGVITAPVLRKDGTILNKRGFDRETGLYLFGRSFPPVSLEPTKEDLKAALSTLWRPFAEFPYATPEDRGACLAAILTACTRRTLPTAPGFIIDAAQAGSGKTYLAQSIKALATGDVGVMTLKADRAEFDKALTGSLLAGDSALLFDNVRDASFNTTAEAFLTSEFYSARVLGGNRMARFPTNVLVLVTANNFETSNDLWRRVVSCRIDAKMENPETRQFAFRPHDECLKNRQAIVAAGLTLLRGYIAAGKPRMSDRGMASYEAWNGLIRGCVLWLAAEGLFECGDPISRQEQARVEDPTLAELARFLAAMQSKVGDEAQTTAQLHGALYGQMDSIFGRLLDNLELGKWLSANKGRIVNGMCIEDCGQDRTKTKLWKVTCG